MAPVEKIPAVWTTHMRRLHAELQEIESKLKDAKGDEALTLRARAEKIRKDIGRLK
ncbi:MAG: hypothetical protein ABR953_15050 [Candidatus Acidiferrales bacterium]|jgi:tetrahydromethanopterin S-methyltransferase subunit G